MKPKSSKSNRNRQWHIVHVVDPGNFPYASMEDENFQKAWALENLKPVEIKGPPKQMMPVSKAQRETNKQMYVGLLEDIKAAKEDEAGHEAIMTLEVLQDLVKRCIYLAPLLEQN